MMDKHFKKSQETWDEIANSFDNTRRKPWRQVVDFTDLLKSTDVVADIGCGNGRHLDLIINRCEFVFGLDISRNLLKITQKKIKNLTNQNVSLIQGNLVYLPFNNNSFDVIICIAALHNIKGRKNRLLLLNEIRKTLKKGGWAMISVWSKEQERFKNCFQKPLKNGYESGDIDVYWRQNNLDIPRFYHLYTKDEFISDILESKLKIENFYEANIQNQKNVDNYFVIVRK